MENNLQPQQAIQEALRAILMAGNLQATQEPPKATMPAKEAATYLNISYWKLLELAKAKKVPHIRAGSRVLFRRESLNDWLAEQEVASVAQAVQPEPIVVKGIRRLK